MNVNKLIKQFFIENDYHRIADRIVVLRGDGISIYSNIEDQYESSSIGALVSGLWQAAESLSSMLKKDDQFIDFRLAFDTTSDGLYVVPFKMMGKIFYLCAIYSDTDNPGKLKRHIRLLKDNLEVFVSEFKLNKPVNKINKEEKGMARSGFLFESISDEEMDKLFAF